MTSPGQRLTLTLNPDLAGRLASATERTGLDPAELILRCVRDHLDQVGSYARVLDEVAQVKDQIVKLAEIIGEALAEPTPAAIGEFCRYKPGKAAKGS